MYFEGIIIGVISFLAIGLFHPIVIKGEYYFSKKIWPIFAIVGLILLIASAFAANTILSAGLAITGMSCWWSIKELFDQEKRVKKGWFPQNPNRSRAVNKD
ncbi:MAG: DUF4491 family protein [Bacillota bacterium]|nr:DUF4491 family protein [Bacillota bacterium]